MILKRIELIQSMFTSHSEISLGINNKRGFGKLTSVWKLYNALLHNQWLEK